MGQFVIGGIVMVLVIILLCLIKPNAGRIFLGFFYIAMGLGVNLVLGITNPQSYIDMGKGSLIPFYRDIFTQMVAVNPILYILPIAIFQIAMGLLILNKGKSVKIGFIGTIIFVLAITPLGPQQFPWLGLPLIQIYLMRKEFDRSLVELIRSKIQRRQNQVA